MVNSSRKKKEFLSQKDWKTQKLCTSHSLREMLIQ